MRFEGKVLAFALPALLVLLVAGLTVVLQALSSSTPTDMAAQAAPSTQTTLAQKAPPPASAPGAKPELVAQEQPAPQPAAPSTTTTTTTSQHGGWTVTCTAAGEPPQKNCSAQFRVVSKENNNALVLVWLLGRDAQGKLLAEFATPSDIQIKPGVTISLDDTKNIGPAEFISCTNNQGCRAALELTPKLTRDLKQAKKANVALTLLNGKQLQIGVEINGIEQALTELGA